MSSVSVPSAPGAEEHKGPPTSPSFNSSIFTPTSPSSLFGLFSNIMNNSKAKVKSAFGLWPEIPTGLTRDERGVYEILIESLKTRVANGQKPPHLAVITDLAKDYDDLTAMVLMRELHRLGLVKLEGFVANLQPAQERARFGRGALDHLGLRNVPIAVGSRGSIKEHKVASYEFEDCPFMAPKSTKFEDGQVLLERIFKTAVREQRKLTLVLLSSLMDINRFTTAHPSLLKEAVANISIQGGMYFDASGNLKADGAAANNDFSMVDAEEFTTKIQTAHIPSTVYTKHAAFATKVPAAFFGELGDSGHPIGVHLRQVQLAQDLKFYSDCLDPKTRYREFMTPEWYLQNKSTWFENHPHDEKLEAYPNLEEVVDYLSVAVLYDALAGLGAVGADVLNALGVLKLPLGGDAIHRIVGTESGSKKAGNLVTDPGIHAKKMRTVIEALLKGSLLSSQQGLRFYS
jgi:hypothetical protein